MQYPKRAFSKKEIYEYAWEDIYAADDKTVSVHISNIETNAGARRSSIPSGHRLQAALRGKKSLHFLSFFFPVSETVFVYWSCQKGESDMKTYAVETAGLTKRFRSIPAVDAIDLKIPQGEIFGLVGEMAPEKAR